MKNKVFVSWSGGKDCNLAFYRALKDGLDPRYLASVIFKGNGRIWPHNLLPEILRAQAEAIGVPIVQPTASARNYDRVFRRMMRDLKGEGITGAVFGNINMGNPWAERHENWVEGVCKPTGITPYLPLFDEDRESLLCDLIDSGFEAVIIAADVNLGKDMLGRKLDYELLNELKTMYESNGRVACYHTLVVDGPIYKNKLDLLETQTIHEHNCWHNWWFLDIIKVGLKERVFA